MHGKGRWGHVLNVDEAKWFSSQSRILSLFSGVGENGSEVGREGTVDRWGHLQD